MPEQTIEVYREPHFAGYTTKIVLHAGEEARLQVFPDVTIATGVILRQAN